MKATIDRRSSTTLCQGIIEGPDTYDAAQAGDDIRCGIRLRDQIARETYYGMNLAHILANVHALHPHLFADMQTVFNAASLARETATTTEA